MKQIRTLLVLITAATATAFAQQSDVKYDQYGMEVKAHPVKSEMRDGILVFESKDAGYKFWFDGRVQADYATFFGVDKDFDPIGDGASIRRARLAIKAQVTKDWYGEIDLDFANGIAELKDAIVRFDGVKNWEFQVGNFKESFSIQRNTSSRYLQFMERTMVSYLAPSRHLGAQVKYNNEQFWVAGGVFFMPIAGLEEITNVQDNNKDYGRSTGHSFTGKAVWRPLHKSASSQLHLGAAISYRTPKASDAPADFGGMRYSTRNSTSINRKKYLDTDVIKGVDHELLYTIEAAGSYEGLRYEAAYIGNTVKLKDDSPMTNKLDKNFGGWYAQAGYLLFGGRQRYDSNGAKFNRVERGRKWGDIEVAARYEYLNLNDFDGDVYGGSAQAYTLGVNYWVNNNVKLMINYQYNDNDRFANGKNKLLVGRDAQGNPTKDFTKVVDPKGKAGVDYSMISVRFEVVF